MMRCFVGRFFGCATCVEHFTTLYDDCIFDHCKLKDDDGQGVVHWIWRFHNAVTQRVAGESDAEPPPPWPSRTDCLECWADDTREDTPTLYEFIKQTYSLGEWIDAKQSKTGKFQRLVDGTGTLWLLGVGGLLASGALVHVLRSHVKVSPSMGNGAKKK
eukprot:NODE_24245_length_632_cov_5.089109.p1 GENE.NODE_24245_length_632_cov_5.089109~~NODE_24245_length_632_cov_5.089109.p1  ORF type:complete len:159 (-),score=24.87 NODE_24245_length_632_cov_5.089109:129-605(-)